MCPRPIGVMMNLKGKTAIVTGSARGIGFSIAGKLASLGAQIAIVDLSEETSRTAAAELEAKYGVKCAGFNCNVASAEECSALITRVTEVFGQIDILVNNAGITRDNLLMKMKEEEWDSVISVNLKSVFNMSKAIVRPMLKTGGAIVNVASVIGLMGNAGQCNYAASKAGIIGFTHSMAKEVAKKNVRVNAVAPGFIDTAMTDVLPEKVREGILASVPMGRLGSPEEVASTVAFLVSDEASYITGQVLAIDGGMVMR